MNCFQNFCLYKIYFVCKNDIIRTLEWIVPSRIDLFQDELISSSFSNLLFFYNTNTNRERDMIGQCDHYIVSPSQTPNPISPYCHIIHNLKNHFYSNKINSYKVMQQLIWPTNWRKEYSQRSSGSNRTSSLIIVKNPTLWMIMTNTLSYEVVTCTMLMLL